LKNKLKKSNSLSQDKVRPAKLRLHIFRLTGFALGLSLLLTLFALLVVGLPPGLTNRIIARAQAAGIPLQVESIRLSPHRGWVLKNFRLYSTSPDDLPPLAPEPEPVIDVPHDAGGLAGRISARLGAHPYPILVVGGFLETFGFVAFTYGKYQGARIAFHSVPKYAGGEYVQPLESVGSDELQVDSSGCIRVLPDDVVAIWDWLDVGDTVIVTTVRDRSSWVRNLEAYPLAAVWMNGSSRSATAQLSQLPGLHVAVLKLSETTAPSALAPGASTMASV
jgi:hypothetical protein